MHAHYLITLYKIQSNKLMKKIIKTSKDKLKNKGIKKALNFFKACGDEWARTTDSRIFSPMLYQLSYITVVK